MINFLASLIFMHRPLKVPQKYRQQRSRHGRGPSSYQNGNVSQGYLTLAYFDMLEDSGMLEMSRLKND